ncbi:helix-turn-helix transcriptional regulator [Parasutterella sp.]|uniref:helix-turn-helix transcriptional regulator n=1 Tax=Parasutterella sp. TaxID=2049037 RepID=UPI003AF08FEC
MSKIKEKEIVEGGVLSVQESAQYLGVSRSSFWRKAKSDGFPSKVVINNKVGYRPEDLEEWHSKQVANREAKRSGVQNYEFFGRALFVLDCHNLARSCVVLNAKRRGADKLEAVKRFDWAFEKMKETYPKVFSAVKETLSEKEASKAWRDFIGSKEEIIKLVWPEIDTDDLTEEEILAF